MFAGAAREAVFSNPDVIEFVNEHFVPVALKAGELNRPPDTIEGDLYREIARSRPLPQGICVVNSEGKVLQWAVAFDGDPQVVEFLARAVKRYQRVPGPEEPLIAERYMRYPSQRKPDMEASAIKIQIPELSDWKAIPSTSPQIPPNALDAKIIGRAVKPNGDLVDDVLQQEHYAEDRFILDAALMNGLAEQLSKAPTLKQKIRLYGSFRRFPNF